MEIEVMNSEPDLTTPRAIVTVADNSSRDLYDRIHHEVGQWLRGETHVLVHSNQIYVEVFGVPKPGKLGVEIEFTDPEGNIRRYSAPDVQTLTELLKVL